ncbi:hypothetical protein HK105_201906 [Polyrhizophydium stewartii]|uniref:Queuosine 5'-phosphate N-glycosylase/hydrolase n=1 Tax=Polyrhizophydium stewartii TaxID=2732419 RepID=A0ABR4NG54_9FUNG|nr:hypothetical protein HK105_003698 [Polyrhizophydium stewartii]
MDVRESAAFIAGRAASVRINHERLSAAADALLGAMSAVAFSTAEWSKHTLHPKTKDESTVDWIFLIDLLNFSFWHERSTRQRFTVEIDGETYKGYWTLCACIQRALRQDIPITSPAFWVSASDEQLRSAFQPTDPALCDEIPMLDTRIDMLRRAGAILVKDFCGRFVNCLRQAEHSAQRLMEIVVRHFGDLFEDAAEYGGRRVVFSKRLQILVADIWACFNGEGLGRFDDISTITMFADYRVPQALVYFGILDYTPELMDLLRKHESYHDQPAATPADTVENASNMITGGHPYEVEIRGCSIWAVELLVAMIRERIAKDPSKYTLRADQINPIIVDFYLWDEAYKNQAAMAHIPIHRTRSIYY